MTDRGRLAQDEVLDALAEQESPKHEAGEVTPILAISQTLWANRRSLKKALLAGLVAGVIISLLIPPQYKSTVHLMPPEQGSGAGMAAMLSAITSKVGLSSSSGFASDLLGMKGSGMLFVGILGSRTVQDRLIDRFDLRKVYWRSTYEATRKKLEGRSDISEDRKTGIIEISVSDTDRNRAQQLANAYVDELNRLTAQVSTTAAHKERVFLEERLGEVEKDLKQAELDLGQYSSKNATLSLPEQGKAMLEAAATLQGQIIAAQSELRGLQQIYTDDNVRVRSVKARVAELQSQSRKLSGTGQTAAAETPADSPYPSIRSLPLVGIKYADLFREAKVQEVVFETLTQQYELAKVQEAKETPSVKVLDSASWPEKRSFPPRTLLTITIVFLFFVGGSVWIVGREMWREVDEHEPHKEFLTNVHREISKAFHRKTDGRFGSAFNKLNGNGSSRDSHPDHGDR
ncbi:MAG TPA: lipopolysaccharide biosynthesis protein [Terriglobales bacterium]|nr:lipopolysaccharide biosynthesis protein [Terriglobales bacterium]